MIRGVKTTSRLVQQELTELGVRFRAAFITLTYAPQVEWSPRHVAALLQHYRKWCRRRRVEFRYVWVMELTQRGVPHYHVIAWLPRGVTPPLPDKQGWWPHGKTQAKWAYSPVGYLVKYASKGIDSAHSLPKGARLWGCGGVSKEVKVERSFWLAPVYVRQLSLNEVGKCEKREGWWTNYAAGVRVRSPWEFDLSANVLRYRGWTEWDIEFLCTDWPESTNPQLENAA